MPYCIYCGEELSEDAKFCRKCGKQISNQTANMCPKCGTKMKKEIYSKALHPFAFNPLGHALGLIRYKERLVCPKCKHKKELE